MIAAQLCRPCDKLVFCEIEPDQHELLLSTLGSDERTKVLLADGYKALKDRNVCQPSSRALILVDPPYQLGSDTERVGALVEHLGKHWRAARIAIWYPLTRDHAKVERLYDAVRGAGLECLAAEMNLQIDEDGTRRGMLGSGMLLIQPPYGMEEELRDNLLPVLKRALRCEVDGRVHWVSSAPVNKQDGEAGPGADDMRPSRQKRKGTGSKGPRKRNK
eukprot:gnl/MRDRNA2_/MRDRNA2_76135_c0_seq2.p1 gnl/MRDRNA2_/MRDRNA2_76135_c0~~gnl/MRDRNA2_/MRDRNA2_76135_c0_seq2.p1  ORF type:complete len:225 (+),score=39.14 gnl/MRDRNA2_/MRDRNA2_76135_c0_seq2:24-677(+)